jgi:hypothetical protein
MFLILTLLVSFSPTWSVSFNDECVMSPSTSGDVLIVCQEADGLSLTVVTKEGEKYGLEPESPAYLEGMRSAVVPVWSPSGKRIAFQVGLDEEPEVLIVTLGPDPSITRFDVVLAPLGVSAASPHWGLTDEWLIVMTSGTGARYDAEGVYGWRLSDGTVIRLIGGIAGQLLIVGDFLYISYSDHGDRPGPTVAMFELAQLLAGAQHLDPVDTLQNFEPLNFVRTEVAIDFCGH